MHMQLMKAAAAAALTLAGMLALSACNAQDSNAGNTTIAVVNGVPIPQARMEYVIKAQVQQGQKDDETMRKQIKEALITREILAQEAVKKGLDKDPQLQTQVDMAKQEFLIRAYFDDFVKTAGVTEDEMKAEYERVKAQQTGDGDRKEYQARHILIKNEKQAKAALAQINKAQGKNFAQVAKAKSEDQGSKAEGGLLDWSDGSNFVKEFSEAMVKLNKGAYTKQLVKTQYGYHIIKLEDVREMQFPPFEQVKERIEQQLLAQKRDKAIEALRTAAKVE
jgi:peptidyl-prolyl cis-trans isomerase C